MGAADLLMQMMLKEQPPQVAPAPVYVKQGGFNFSYVKDGEEAPPPPRIMQQQTPQMMLGPAVPPHYAPQSQPVMPLMAQHAPACFVAPKPVASSKGRSNGPFFHGQG